MTRPAASAHAGTAGSGGSQPHSFQVELKGVHHWYGTRDGSVHAIDGIDLTIAPGEFVCVVGASGCGKTTLLQMIAGFLRPTVGEITMGGRPIEGPHRSRGVVFQQPTLYPWLSVAENVSFGPRMAGEKRSSYRPRVERYLEMVGLQDFAHRAPYELSGGMQQRAAIARVMVNDPDIMLMDEPFGALDAFTRERLQEELLKIWRRDRKSVFFITHSVEEAVFLGTRVVVMSPRPGRIVLERDVRLGLDDVALPAARSMREFNEVREEIDARIHEHDVEAR